jgi:N-acetylglucosamine-6-phosphate deacetylase
VDVGADAGSAGQRSGGHVDGGTVGAGAERSAVGVPDGSEPDRPRGEPSLPGAGGSPRRLPPGEGPAVLDVSGLVVAPGLVDLQCNGAAGIDLTAEPERLWEVAAVLPRRGVTAWLPTIVSSPPEVRARALAAWRAGPPPGAGPVAAPLGLHLEGPFLAPERRGAHDRRHLVPPSVGLVEDEGWSAEAGVALVTLAPELPGALDVVRRLVAAGVVVAAGHSSATAAEARAAADAGVTWVTHLFNAMAPLHHRAPGLAGVALADPRLRVGLIADGLHVDPTVVAVAARALGDRLTLVTDAVAALGAPPGPVRLGSATARVEGGAVRLADGTLAGSALSLDRAVRNLAAFADLPLATAVRAATATPAAVLGLDDRGAVVPGARADLVVLTPDGEVVVTIVGGRVAHDARPAA